MAQKFIDQTTPQPNGKIGDDAFTAFEKLNDNARDVETRLKPLESGIGEVGDDVAALQLGLQQETQARQQADAAMDARLIGKNMLINCGLPINQRVFAGGALAAGAYGYDRWKAGAGGCNVTINAATGVFTHTSGPLQQIVEAPVLAWGQPLTISVENPSGNITVNVGGATGTITSGTGRRGVTVTPSGSGNMTVQLTATGVTYSHPQLERGSAATPFDARPIAAELAMCQRYYEKSYTFDVKPGAVTAAGRVSVANTAVTGGTIYSAPAFRVEKRTVPSVTVWASNNAPISGAVAQDDGSIASNATLLGAGTASFDLRWTNTAGRWGGFFHWVADAEL
jgi:hypothetical protein